ncbi:MAG TPA: EAL domain-containing protein [Symbiobacteriaceae bacterium]|nr:EAL domain-containing protein [Symbiobacteriaceae bacterium]
MTATKMPGNRTPLPDWGTAGLIGVAAYFLLHVAAGLLERGGLITLGWLREVGLIPVPAVVTVLAWRNGGLGTVAGRERRGWRLLAAAFGIYCAAKLLGFLSDFFALPSPTPSPAMVLYLVHHPFLLGAILSLLRRPSGFREWAVVAMDAMTVAVGGWMLLQNFFALHGSTVSPGAPPDTLTLVYAAGDLLLLFGFIAATLQAWPGRLARTGRWIAAGLLTTLMGDLAYSLLQTHGQYRAGAWPDTLWIAAQAMIAMGARGAWLVETGLQAPPAEKAVRPWYGQLLPYGALMVAFGALLSAGILDAAGLSMVAGVLVVTVTVISRQAAVLWENSRLLATGAALTERLAHQAYHDALTGLANRTLFYERLKSALVNHRRTGSPLGVLFLDLDGFKTVNDSLGHQAGDRLIMAVAGRLLRVTGSGTTVARLGGDEFAVLVEGAGDREAAAAADALQRVLQQPVAVDGREVFVEASIGVAVSPQGEETADELLRNADVAMYAAKGRGKGRISLYHPQMHQRAVHRLDMEADLRWALDGKEFVLHYQPIVDLRTGTVTGVEALVRWQHPRCGLLAPDTFIPLAEETGLIVPLGLFVLQEACRQAVQWREAGRGGPVKMAVNVSPRQLLDPTFVRDVARVLRQCRLEPSALILEITESVFVDGADAALRTLAALRRLGVLIAIDDFGTGYSSLGYLRRFPADILKIDRSFVEQLGNDAKDAAVVQAIADLSATLGLETVAEGVEQDKQAAVLRKLQCGRAQGFLFGRPAPAEQISRILQGQPSGPN